MSWGARGSPERRKDTCVGRRDSKERKTHLRGVVCLMRTRARLPRCWPDGFCFAKVKVYTEKKLEYTEVQILHEPICRMPHSLKFMHGNTDKHTPLPTDEVEGHNVGGTRSLQEGKPPHPNSLHQHRLVLFYFCNRDSFYTMQLVQGRGN